MAFVITDGRPQFAPVSRYYSTFPQEVTTTASVPVSLPTVEADPRTFQGLVYALNTYAYQRKDNDVVIVVHGHMGDSGPVGLSIPLNERTNLLAVQEAFDDLEEMLNNRLRYQKIGSDDEAKLRGMTQTIRGATVAVRVDAGMLEQVFNVLVMIRYRELCRVEIRACNLGLNRTVLGTLGRLLGCRFISAPNVHMFYVQVNTGRKMTSQGFDQWVKNARGCRVFQNPLDAGDKLAIRVNGKGPFRSTDAATTSTNLNWFVKGFIKKDSIFSANTSFVIEGMDHESTDKPFVLPLESEYAGHIVQLGPLPSLDAWMKGQDPPPPKPSMDPLDIINSSQ